METTGELEGEVHFGELEFTNLLKSLIRGYRFTHKNNDPKVIVIPAVMVVNGIEVRYEGVVKVTKVKRGKE